MTFAYAALTRDSATHLTWIFSSDRVEPPGHHEGRDIGKTVVRKRYVGLAKQVVYRLVRAYFDQVSDFFGNAFHGHEEKTVGSGKAERAAQSGRESILPSPAA